MKTIIAISLTCFIFWILFFRITDYLCTAKDSKLRRFWNKYLVDFGDVAMTVPDIKFHYIKLVVVDYKIRIFSNFGSYICDITVCGNLGVTNLQIGEACEIAYIKDNFLLVYEQLKKYEK